MQYNESSTIIYLKKGEDLMFKTLLNPFENHTDRTLSIFGILVLLTMILLCWQWNIIADGIIQLHNTTEKPLWKVIINLGINVGLLSLLMFGVAKLSYQKTRFIDVLKVVLVANFAQVMVMLLLFNPFLQEMMMPLEKAILEGDMMLKTVPQTNLIVISIVSLFAVGMLYYFFHLLVLGMKIAMNSKKAYHVILIILLTMILDTFLHFFNPYLI